MILTLDASFFPVCVSFSDVSEVPADAVRADPLLTW